MSQNPIMKSLTLWIWSLKMDNDEIARSVYDLDCEEILRALAFLDDDAAILKWARSVKQTMVVAASDYAKSKMRCCDD